MYKPSRIYALIGIPLLMVAVAVIALSADPRDSSPNGTLIPIFALIIVFVVGLFALQKRDLARARRASAPPPEWIGREVDDPTRVSDGELWAAMAVGPIDEDAAEAQSHAWDLAENSVNTGILVTAVILVVVPLMYLTGSPVPVLVGAPVIVGIALVKGLGMMGGGIAGAYESAARAMEPLGLRQTERPTVGVTERLGPPGGPKADIRGGLGYTGERHGRPVRVRWEGGACEIRVGGVAPPEFEARSGDGRIRNRKQALPPGVAEALESVPRSSRWKNLRVEGGAEGIVVRRKPSGTGSEWLCDLWLAERVADSVRS